MPEVAECKGCGAQDNWTIYKYKIKCDNCGKEYKWPVDCEDDVATKAQDIIHLVNDNF